MMRKNVLAVVALLGLFALCVATPCAAQNYSTFGNGGSKSITPKTKKASKESNTVITPGILNGGISIIGLDFEVLFGKRIGLQGGVGLTSYGAAINFHLGEGGPRSSFVGFNYYAMQMGDYLTGVGPSFNYRSKKWFYGSVGMMGIMDKGRLWYEGVPQEYQGQEAMLTYSIGAYFCL